MRLRFTVRATENLVEIADYLYQHNPQAARYVRASIYEGLKTLLLFPRAGRAQKTEGIRKLVTPKYGYLIYYVIDETAEELIILNVKHPAQKRDHEDA